MHDLVIRGGTVVDGTGAPARTADVAVRDGLVVEVGPKAGPGRREVDAAGLLVTPGFIDIHTHYDGQATWDSEMAPSCFHGVTTIVMGNCGVGFAPVRPDRHEWLIQVMEGVEDIPGTALAEGIPARCRKTVAALPHAQGVLADARLALHRGNRQVATRPKSVIHRAPPTARHRAAGTPSHARNPSCPQLLFVLDNNRQSSDTTSGSFPIPTLKRGPRAWTEAPSKTLWPCPTKKRLRFLFKGTQ